MLELTACKITENNRTGAKTDRRAHQSADAQRQQGTPGRTRRARLVTGGAQPAGRGLGAQVRTQVRGPAPHCPVWSAAVRALSSCSLSSAGPLRYPWSSLRPTRAPGTSGQRQRRAEACVSWGPEPWLLINKATNRPATHSPPELGPDQGLVSAAQHGKPLPWAPHASGAWTLTARGQRARLPPVAGEGFHVRVPSPRRPSA